MIRPGGKYGFLSSPTDINGQFVISNVAASAYYKITLASGNYRLTRPKSVRTVSNKPTICDLTVFDEAKIFVKVIDESGAIVPKYFLRIESDLGEQQGLRNVNVDQIKTPWYRVMPFGWQRTSDTIITIRARYQDQLSETVTNLLWNTGSEKYITLILHPQIPQVTGRLCYFDGSPAVGKTVSAKTKQSGKDVRAVTEDDGYFEVIGLRAEENDIIKLMAFNNRTDTTTNVLNGSRDIIFRFNDQQKIIGKVFYDSLDIPATNFIVCMKSVDERSSSEKGFKTEDGFFEINYANDFYSLIIKADGYAPKNISFGMTKNIICDLGNIILRKSNATLEGKVINHLAEPLYTEVTLIAGNNQQRFSALTKTNPEDGTYKFTGIPAENVTILVRLTLPFATGEIGPLALKADETTIAPDLVIWTTNLIQVDITLLMPDGSPAANTMISIYHKMTDSNGKIILWLPVSSDNTFIAYTDYQRTSDGFSSGRTSQKFFSETFDITPETSQLTLQLVPPDKISGTITKDGQPFTGTIYLCNKKTFGYFSARNGKFTVSLPPGDYFVISTEQGVLSRTQLTIDGKNHINFKKENGRITVSVPQNKIEDWKINIEYEYKAERRSFRFRSSNIDNKTGTVVFENMPKGEYSIVAKRIGNNATSLWKSISIKSDEQATISF